MSWDEVYNQLEQELGRPPKPDEVQARMLETIDMDLAVEEEP